MKRERSLMLQYALCHCTDSNPPISKDHLDHSSSTPGGNPTDLSILRSTLSDSSGIGANISGVGVVTPWMQISANASSASRSAGPLSSVHIKPQLHAFSTSTEESGDGEIAEVCVAHMLVV